ncbi:hypothetical protein FHG87_010573 [Trinorchestia longiramus]|nr:hypothetical protein FHG87_010573 [Trinorchestia longiramus]
MSACIVVLSLLLAAATVQTSPTVAGKPCTQKCTNRYGLTICCDNVPLNEDLRCPPMPRVLVDCTDPSLVVQDISVKVAWTAQSPALLCP